MKQYAADIMTNQIREVIIPKEEAVFWLDKAGCWRNAGGKFRNKKVIDYFHAAIGKDDAGYFVSHVRDDVVEKVYFRYEDTALFVLDVLMNETAITLVLNTGEYIPLDPGNLYIRDDNLYVLIHNEPVKFSERMMMRLSSFITEDEGLLFFKWNNQTYNLSEKGKRDEKSGF
jgi:hypothetical protein